MQSDVQSDDQGTIPSALVEKGQQLTDMGSN